MEKEIIQQVISHIEKEGLLVDSIPSTEDEFVKMLYINSNDRKEIIRALISLFSEEYKTDLERAVSIDNDIAIKMHELGFVPKEKRLHFIMGMCSKEEQQDVYEKMFKALHFALIAQEHDYEYSSSLLTENLPKQSTQRLGNRLKKNSKKKFDVEQAKENLKVARKTLTEATQFMHQHQLLHDKPIHRKLEFKENGASELPELSSTAVSFKQTMEIHDLLSSGCSVESESVPAELGSAVGELHSVLQLVADATKQSSTEQVELKKKLDLEKMLTQADELMNDSVVIKCYSRDISFSDGNTSIN